MLTKIEKVNPLNMAAVMTIAVAISAVIQQILVMSFAPPNVIAKLGGNVGMIFQSMGSIIGYFIGMIIVSALYNFCASTPFGGQIAVYLSENPAKKSTVYLDSYDLVPCVRVYAFLFGLLSLIPAVFVFIVTLITKNAFAPALGLLIGIPIFSVVGAVIASALGLSLYNLVAPIIKGFKFTMDMKDGHREGKLLHMDIWQGVKVISFFYLLIGLLTLIAYGTVMALAGKFTLVLLAIPIVAVIIGGLVSAISLFLVNLSLQLTGGIEVTLGGLPPVDGGGDQSQGEQSA
jgi:hypothetical protein